MSSFPIVHFIIKFFQKLTSSKNQALLNMCLESMIAHSYAFIIKNNFPFHKLFPQKKNTFFELFVEKLL